MNRLLQYFNLAGVLALSVLCAVQWQANSHQHAEIVGLQSLADRQKLNISEQAERIKKLQADLEDFRARLVLSESQLREIDEKLADMTAQRNRFSKERDHMAAECDQIKANRQQWIDAVAARDADLRSANDQIKKLAADRDDAIQRFNDLASKYNAMIKKIESANTNEK